MSGDPPRVTELRLSGHSDAAADGELPAILGRLTHLQRLDLSYNQLTGSLPPGLDRQQCAVHIQRTVGRHIRGLNEDDLTHLDRVLLPILRRLARERPPEAGPSTSCA